MKKFIIKDLASLKKYLLTIDNPVFAVGARPYNITLGVHNLFKNFKILTCKETTSDAEFIKKKIETICPLTKNNEFRNLANYKDYIPATPSDLIRNKRVTALLNSYKLPPILLFFKLSKKLNRLIKKRSYVSIASSLEMYHKYENKINFKKLIDQLEIASPKNIIVSARNLDYAKLKTLIGEKFVIQLPSTALGTGTFFIFTKKDFLATLKKPAITEAARGNLVLKVTQYIERDSSPSMTVCVTKTGIVYTGLQKQIIDAKEVIEKGRRSGVYCGHDWTSSSFNWTIQNKAAQIAQKIGDYFKDKEAFNGIFGIDFVLEKKSNNLYPIEVNIRLLGSFPVLSMVQEKAGQPLIQGIQIIEGLNRSDYTLDIESLNRLMAKNKLGAHLNIYSRDKELVYVSGKIKPGIYEIDLPRKKITFLREGVFFSDLRNKKEILLTYGIPLKNRVYKQHGQIGKLISLNSFLTKDDTLTDFAKLMVKFVYKEAKLKKIK